MTVLLWICAMAIGAADVSSTFIHDVRIIDARGDHGVHDLLIAGDRIAGIDPKDVPGDARIIDGTGRTLLPGLIDSHVHITMIPAADFHNESASDRHKRHDAHLRAYLAWGVTTIVDPGVSTDDAREIRQLLDEGPGPEVIFIGPLLGPKDGYPSVVIDTLAGISTADEVRTLIAEYQQFDPVGLKVTMEDGPLNTIWPLHSEGIQATIIEEAERHNLNLYVHAMDPEMARAALRLNPHALVHAPQKGDRQLAREIAAQSVYVCTTLDILGATLMMWNPEILDDPRIQLTVPADEIDAARDPAVHKHMIETGWRTVAPGWPLWLGRLVFREWLSKRYLETAIRMVRILNEQGVPLVLASDSPGWPIIPFILHGPSTHLELELLSRAGLSPIEILRAGTLTPAEMLGMDKELGTIEVGKRADILVVVGDPLQDIKALRNPVWVIRAGELRSPEDWIRGD